MTLALEAANVTVRYGRKIAVDDVSLAVAEGSVFALLGRNGSGKSSLVRTVLGQLRPDGGSVRLFDEDAWVRRAALMDRVAVVPEDSDAPPDMRVGDLAWFSSRLYSRWRQDALDARLERFGIAPRSRFGDLSKGQKKQVLLALALAMSPDLLVLDDPTLGLDVVARKSLFEEVLVDLADRGLTVLVTTHDLDAVETIADRVGILRGGRLVLDEETETLKARFRRIRVPMQPVAAFPGTTLVATSVRRWGSGVEAVVSNFDELEFERMREEVRLTPADVAPLSLEEIFIAVSGEEGVHS
jgi:ABC-2 type transport system ATP-binding protein